MVDCWQLLVYVQCYFLTIATLLGAGVLGIPVELAKSGLVPFIISFTPSMLIQVLIVYYTVDLLQKCVAIQLEASSNPQNDRVEDEERDPLVAEAKANYDGVDNSQSVDETVSGGDVRSPDLHMIAEYFLPGVMTYLLDIHVIISQSAFCISFALAGSQAFSDLCKLKNTAITLPIFCWALNVLVLFGKKLVMPLVSVLTFFKGCLLVITVMIAFVVGSTIGREIQTDYAYIGEPFLMGSVAISGMPFTMPYIYSKIKHVPNQIISYRRAVVLGIVTVFLLNVLWAWAVLDVVPQYNSCPLQALNSSPVACVREFNYTLLSAKVNGQISTVPFNEVIENNHPQYKWVAFLITLFIVVSVTVSYAIISTALLHTTDGLIYSVWPRHKWRCLDIGNYLSTTTVVSNMLGFCFLSVVFAVALLNPKGFVTVLDSAGSLLMNSFVAVFLSVAIWRATSSKFSHLEIPVPLGKPVVHLQYLAIFYFYFAIVYDIVDMSLSAAGIDDRI